MTDAERREAARQFYQKWNGKGKEDEDDRSYWLDILQRIMGAEDATDRIEFQKKVIVDGHTKRIDAYIPETKVIIEQKSLGIGLDKKINQSGGIALTPYEQAKRYNDNLPSSEKARWIVTSNFAEIWVYDMDTRVPEQNVTKISIKDLQSQSTLLGFLLEKKVKKVSKEVELSKEAGTLVGKIYDAFLKQYHHPDDKKTLESLNILCVRLVFCLYAEDAGVFDENNRNIFSDYIKQYEPKDLRQALLQLFKVLDTKENEREDLYLSDELEQFPYVNGGLFENENVIIPKITQEIKDTLLDAAQFDWRKISPTIFGAVFESTLNPETRRSGGMHYTSIENIHKVIDPLFLDDLKKELEEIKQIKNVKKRDTEISRYSAQMSRMIFLDPACGSGNFLTETYISLRRLENEAIALMEGGQKQFGEVFSPIKVSISQFYGIEINDFAVDVAKTALWIAELQMLKETEDIIEMHIDPLPLETNAYIVCGNALRMDWEDVVPKDKLNYIMGNPPFVANSGRVSSKEASVKAMMSEEKKESKIALFGKNGGVLDYVACWFKKAALYMQNTSIEAAFVSTNSICQGEQVAPLWKDIFNEGVYINFAHRSFAWKSEATKAATVYVVIIGFSYNQRAKKYIFDNELAREVNHINAYLVDADDVFIEKRTKPLCEVNPMHRGSQPTDNGNFIFTESEYTDFIENHPEASKLFRKFMMGKDFIDRKPRYCLWLSEVNPTEIKKYPLILNRISAIRDFRLKSTKAATRKKADTPTLFDENQQPSTNFVALPEVSSGGRRYIPIDFMTPEIVVGNKIRIVENAGMYDFGVLTSNVHMAWMRATCGYYGPSYQYSVNIVYNNFPWPEPTDAQKQKIEQTAQAILDARALYPNSSLADLYDPLTMPRELLKAHQANDRAVMEAYGLDVKTTSEADCVAFLMKRYQKLTQQ